MEHGLTLPGQKAPRTRIDTDVKDKEKDYSPRRREERKGKIMGQG